MSEESKIKRFSGTIAFVICFVIGCMFLYWAVEYWVYNSFDSNRYELSKIQVGNSDSLSTWKLDKRTGNLEYCTKSYEKMDHFVCVRSVTIDAKEYSNVPEAVAATAPATATGTATATAPATATGTATAPAQAATTPAQAATTTTTATAPAEVPPAPPAPPAPPEIATAPATATEPAVDEVKQPAKPVAAKPAPVKPAPHNNNKKHH